MFLGFELLPAENQSHVKMVAAVPDTFLRIWQQAGIRPAEVRVASRVAEAALHRTAHALKVRLRRLDAPPGLEAAMRSIPL